MNPPDDPQKDRSFNRDAVIFIVRLAKGVKVFLWGREEKANPSGDVSVTSRVQKKLPRVSHFFELCTIYKQVNDHRQYKHGTRVSKVNCYIVFRSKD